jgi:hypothetical protein
VEELSPDGLSRAAFEKDVVGGDDLRSLIDTLGILNGPSGRVQHPVDLFSPGSPQGRGTVPPWAGPIGAFGHARRVFTKFKGLRQ